MRIITLALVLFFGSSLAFAQELAPSFTASGMDGTVYSMDQLRGKVVVVNLWFIGCPSCVEEIMKLNPIVEKYKSNKNVVFLGLAANRKPELESFLKNNPFNYNVIPNASMIIIGKFGTPDKRGQIEMPFPMHYVIDREGKITVKVQGMKGVEAVAAELTKQTAAK
jgi:peroxiredoxin